MAQKSRKATYLCDTKVETSCKDEVNVDRTREKTKEVPQKLRISLTIFHLTHEEDEEVLSTYNYTSQN